MRPILLFVGLRTFSLRLDRWYWTESDKCQLLEDNAMRPSISGYTNVLGLKRVLILLPGYPTLFSTTGARVRVTMNLVSD